MPMAACTAWGAAPGVCLTLIASVDEFCYDTLQCVAEHQPCGIDFRFGTKVMQVIDAVLESAETRQWVPVK